MHPQGVVLLFDMGSGNSGHIRHSANDGLFDFHHFRRAIPRRSLFEITEMGHGERFYQLPVVCFRSKGPLNRVRIGVHRIGRNLDAVCHAPRQIVHKRFCVVRIAFPDRI